MADKPAYAPDGNPTFRPMRTPVVLVAGGPAELFVAAQRTALDESATITVHECTAAAVATETARLRPFALVVSQDIYAFDGEEFVALARDVHADLIVLKVSSANASFLEQALRPSLRTAFRRFRTEQESGPVRR